MTRPCIICVAITGSVPTKAANPAVPITIAEQVESTHEAFEAGATIAHCHVRNDDETPTSDPARFALLKEGLERHCPGMIVQFSTGGRSGAGKARGGMLSLRPDMASLSVGSNNFPTRVYENPPDLVDWLASEMIAHEVTPEIEAFDLSHILQAIARHEAGGLHGKLYVQFVMGVKKEECHARRQGRLRLLRPDHGDPRTRRPMVCSRHRRQPDRRQRMGHRRRRPYPDRPRRQCPPRPPHPRPLQRGARETGRRALREIRTPGGQLQSGSGNSPTSSSRGLIPGPLKGRKQPKIPQFPL
ncbi:MAG: 3-keto-5-aminohexanoate cleavage protein [Geminicoccaceae bacterium]|nr:3-keto-5-aminohexanoate cleavage protein [Geminicoccaceae bacterium]